MVNWIHSCTECNEYNNPPKGFVKAQLHSIESDNRFQLVCFDLARPFIPTTTRGNQYALIIVDHFTHWPEFVALSNMEAKTIAHAIHLQFEVIPHTIPK